MLSPILAFFPLFRLLMKGSPPRVPLNDLYKSLFISRGNSFLTLSCITMGRLLYSLQLAAKTPPSKPEPESESSAVYHLIHPHPGIEQRGGTWGERAWPSSQTAFDRSRISQTTSGVSEDELARQAREFRQMMDAVETVDREIEYQRRRYEENMNLSSSEIEAGEWVPTGESFYFERRRWQNGRCWKDWNNLGVKNCGAGETVWKPQWRLEKTRRKRHGEPMMLWPKACAFKNMCWKLSRR
ncbi:hypothetical protein BDP27DRAFT_316714 [Rhodocollybia butyracea]|uniref:Uncharacterized protein n=1 Tax=Rhodocollybia butyracea TaxID=206335 RepID=A0A9P5Q354_9AGAR|nr:hypothetical protein BDP27DRAFT_316714 [Rhodocollybia butyracea]